MVGIIRRRIKEKKPFSAKEIVSVPGYIFNLGANKYSSHLE